ncbi:hypothetical protein HYT02_06110 [Candidatus Gottesmanbacteria bacterium]|nr:hypothetical protein [Candidatus Gottesmanbacteria bacterium]
MEQKYAIVLRCTVCLIFIWAISPYQSFGVQIAASLLAIYVTKFAFRHHLSITTETLIDSTILTALTLTIVSSSGGLTSPVFFLVYFLLFILSLLLTPTIPLIISFALILYFLFSSSISTQSELIPLLSFPLITPLAVYFGRQHKGRLHAQHDAMHLTETVRRETQDVLLWISTTFTRNLEELHTEIEKIPNLTDLQWPHIKKLQQTIIRLSKMGRKLQDAIEED